MNHLNKMQLLSAWVTVIGGFIAVYVYLDNKRDDQNKKDIILMEKQIKALELANQLHLAKSNGIM